MSLLFAMRQLKGKVQKESRKEKRERQQENLENKNNVLRIVLPTMFCIVAMIIGIVYMNTRPRSLND